MYTIAKFSSLNHFNELNIHMKQKGIIRCTNLEEED